MKPNQTKIFDSMEKLLFVLTTLSILVSCSRDTFEVAEPTRKTCKMELVANLRNFDQNYVETRAGESTTDWKDGDKIYIVFYDGDKIIPGEATYTAASEQWTISYDDILPKGENLNCKVYYFVNATFSSSSLVSLNCNTAIYEDQNATFSYSDGVVIVKASLIPKTSRIRFTGKANEKIYIYGLTTYSSFSPAINTFSTTNAMQNVTVSSTGSTPYLYGYLMNEDRMISVIGSDIAYTRTCNAEMLNIGDSGYMAIPTASAHNSWRDGMIINVEGAEYKMIPVIGHSSGLFLIGETEVTEAQYNTINGTPSSSLLPISNINYDICNNWIIKLKSKTSLSFSLPTYEQWMYAAKGGNKSQNYIYAGSNIPNDVAWYSANCSSPQKVKQKAPNELGLFDMSGNVSEWTSTKTTGGYRYSHYFAGGNYTSSDTSIYFNSYSYESTSYFYEHNYIGFRIILTCN